MEDLFRIETDRATLVWASARGGEPGTVCVGEPPDGVLQVSARRRDLTLGPVTFRAGVPEAVSRRLDETAGPRVFEQTDYALLLRGKNGSSVAVSHRDPTLLRDLRGNGDICHGTVNFGSDVGLSQFSVMVDNKPEFDFTVEVFPTKLDYRSDYERLLTEVEDTLRGLVYEYLRATYRSGASMPAPSSSGVEWLVLLRHVVDDLERALLQIARTPRWGLSRVEQLRPAARIKRTDAALRRAVMQGKGSGPGISLNQRITIRSILPESHPRPTLDTPEHRWLAAQLRRIRGRLALLHGDGLVAEQSKRRVQVVSEMTAIAKRVLRLERLEPLMAANGGTPAGFASLQLLTTPGYREAYRACMILSLGLSLSGGPVGLSVKQLSELFEYWCFFALLRLVSEETGIPVRYEDLLAVDRHGLRVRLARGKATAIRFRGDGRQVEVEYNRAHTGKNYLVPQQPDIVLNIEDQGWPVSRLVLDSKYRVEASERYVRQYGSPGPPEDALNVLHRYRDAILTTDGRFGGANGLGRTVVQAAALYPYCEPTGGDFRKARLWQALEHLGVGAIPVLPGSLEYLREWVRSGLRQGGWALAERAMPHLGRERASDWRQAAGEAVLIGVLKPGAAREHLDWILQERRYYMPLRKHHSRQYTARWVGVYSPAALRSPGAVTHWGRVKEVRVVRRDDIPTPWGSARGAAELCALYELDNLEKLLRPVENRGHRGRGESIRSPRWTSRLALERARTLEELLLETEPEWRLCEALAAVGFSCSVSAGPVGPLDATAPMGRAWIAVGDLSARYEGAAGFRARDSRGQDQWFRHVDNLVSHILRVAGKLSSPQE